MRERDWERNSHSKVNNGRHFSQCCSKIKNSRNNLARILNFLLKKRKWLSPDHNWHSGKYKLQTFNGFQNCFGHRSNDKIFGCCPSNQFLLETTQDTENAPCLKYQMKFDSDKDFFIDSFESVSSGFCRKVWKTKSHWMHRRDFFRWACQILSLLDFWDQKQKIEWG